MKKIVALFAIVATALLTSCGNGNGKTNENGTDSTAVAVDSLAVDSLKVDSTVVDSAKVDVKEVKEVK